MLQILESLNLVPRASCLFDIGKAAAKTFTAEDLYRPPDVKVRRPGNELEKVCFKHVALYVHIQQYIGLKVRSMLKMMCASSRMV